MTGLSNQMIYYTQNNLNATNYGYYCGTLCLYDMTGGTETQISADITDPDVQNIPFTGAKFAGDKLYGLSFDRTRIYCIDDFSDADSIKKVMTAALTNADQTVEPLYTSPTYLSNSDAIEFATDDALFFYEGYEGENGLRKLDLTD